MHNHFFSDQIKILIVDDEASIRKLVERLLSSQGYKTYLADNGEQAFEMLTESIFDIVITDVAMPEMDGIELTKRIVEFFPSDVIVMTGQIDKYS